MRQLLPLTGATLLAASALAACSSASGLTINLYISPEDHLQTVVDRCTQEAAGRYKIVYNKLPRGADGQREQMVRRLAAGDTSLDVLGLDVTWVPEFAEAGWAEEWTGANAAAATRDVLPGPLATAKWNGKLYGATKNTNVQLLWYDDRITPTPPKSFDELMTQAQQLKAAGKPYQVVFTGAQYEGLVVFYNTLVASSSGHILSDDGKSVVMDDGAVRALELLKKLTTAGITDPSLTNQKEDDIRQAFQRGQAATELNWPFVYASYAKEKPQDLPHFKWTRYPSVAPGRPAASRSAASTWRYRRTRSTSRRRSRRRCACETRLHRSTRRWWTESRRASPRSTRTTPPWTRQSRRTPRRTRQWPTSTHEGRHPGGVDGRGGPPLTRRTKTCRR